MIGWRKLIAFALVSVVVGVSALKGLDLPKEAADLMKITVGLFFGANLAKPLITKEP